MQKKNIGKIFKYIGEKIGNKLKAITGIGAIIFQGSLPRNCMQMYGMAFFVFITIINGEYELFSSVILKLAD